MTEREIKEQQKLGELLVGILNEQRQTMNVRLKIGSVSETGHVMHNCLVIEDAPPAIISYIVEQDGFGFLLSAGHGGLLITVFPA